jgi:SAM-dependent methyltransferase
MMGNSLGNAASDPVGSGTLESIGEARAFNKWMYSAISPFIDGKILEIGSGLGNISEFLIKDKTRVVLSDLRQEYCNYLQERFRGSSSLESIHEIDIADKNFSSRYSQLTGTFDSVFALNVVEHIGDDSLAIRNCRTLLKEKGTLVILVPAYQWLFCRFDSELGHFRRYNRRTLGKLLSDNGFQEVTMFNFNAAGTAGWTLFGKILKGKQVKEGQMRLYNNFVPVFRLIDKLLFHKFGLSLIIVAKK